jgi:PAS domain S-box-containing protein
MSIDSRDAKIQEIRRLVASLTEIGNGGTVNGDAQTDDDLDCILQGVKTLAARVAPSHDKQPLLDDFPFGVVRTTVDGRFLYVNRKLCEITGYNADELMHLNFQSITHPDDLPTNLHKLDQAVVGMIKSYRIDKRYIRKDGSTVWVNVTGVLMRDTQGKPDYIAAVIEDRLERDRNEAQRQAVTVGLRKVLAATNQLMSCPNVDTLLRQAVEVARNTLGLERCGIFFDHGEYIQGTYGTDGEGNTTDEHDARVILQDQWPQHVEQLKAEGAQWLMVDDRKHTEWDGEEIKVVGTGWVVITLIPLAEGRKAYLFNDTYISNAPIDETQQEIVAVFCSLLGKMIQRVEVENALHASETRLQQAVRAAKIGIFEHDHLTDKIYWSPVQREILGWDDEIAEIENLEDAVLQIYPDDRERIKAAIQRAHDPRGDGVYDVEYRVLARDGSIRWLSVHSITSFEGEGRDRHFVRTVGATADITDRRGVEEALRESEQMLRNILDSIPVRVFWKDMNLRVLGCNQHFADDMGVALPADLIGKTDVDLIRERGLPWLDQAILYRADDLRVIEQGESIFGQEEPQMRDDQQLYWARTNKLPLRNANGKITGLLCTYEDITERRQTELALQKKREDEQELLRYLTLLHEISRELTMIDALDDFYRRTVELGRTMLGFDRVSLWLYDAPRNSAIGTYGTNINGNLQSEAHMSFVVEPNTEFWAAMQKPDRFLYAEKVSLYHNFGVAGTGWIVVIALWIENRVLGWLSVDNLIKQQPISPPQIEILAQYGLHIASMLSGKQVKQALHDSEVFLQKSQTVGRIGSYYFNIPQDRWMSSPMLNELFGIDDSYAKDLDGWLALVHPDDRAGVGENLREVTEKKRSRFDKEFRVIRHNDGQEYWVHGLGELEFDEHGNVIKIIGTVQDISQYKRVVNALRESEQMLHNVLDTIPVRVFWKDLKLRLMGCNLAFVKDAGVDSAEALIGKQDNELLPDPALAGQAAKYNQDDLRVLETGMPLIGYEETQIRADGGQYWLRTSKVPLRDAAGTTIGVLCIYEDITERKYAEERLRASEHRLREAQRLAHVGHWDTSDKALIWSEEMYRIFGLEVGTSALTIDQLVERVYPDDQMVFKQSVATALQTGRSVENEFRVLRPDGTLRYAHSIVNPSMDTQGSLLGLFGTVLDITERKQTQEALQRYNQRLAILREIDRRILVAHSPLALASTVLDQLVQLIPCDWVGIVLYDKTLTEEHVYALQVASGIAVERQKRDAVIFNSVIEQLKLGHSIISDDIVLAQEPVSYLAEELLTQDIHAIMSTPLLIHGQLIGTLVLASKQIGFFTVEHEQISEDIAAQIAIALHQADLNDQIARHNAELEERVRERTAELQQANEEIKNFAYIVSHDLRAPLVNLKGFAAELRLALDDVEVVVSEIAQQLDNTKTEKLRTAFGTDIPEALRFIDSSVTQMDGFTKAILKLSRLGRTNLELVEVNPNTVVDKVLTGLAYQINQAGIKVNVAPLPTLITDYFSLEQIFGNILTNAVTYLDPARVGEITVTGESTDKETIFRVQDNGRGIAEEDMDKVFAPFRRAGRQNTPGEGMGMAYVQALVRRHGGQITCESVLGAGTTFTFTIARQLTKDVKL